MIRLLSELAVQRLKSAIGFFIMMAFVTMCLVLLCSCNCQVALVAINNPALARVKTLDEVETIVDDAFKINSDTEKTTEVNPTLELPLIK